MFGRNSYGIRPVIYRFISLYIDFSMRKSWSVQREKSWNGNGSTTSSCYCRPRTIPYSVPRSSIDHFLSPSPPLTRPRPHLHKLPHRYFFFQLGHRVNISPERSAFGCVWKMLFSFQFSATLHLYSDGFFFSPGSSRKKLNQNN